MSEQNRPSKYMEVFDQWTTSTVINPLEAAFACEIDEGTVAAICKAIRAKQLEATAMVSKRDVPSPDNR